MNIRPPIAARSLGLKLLLVGALAFLLWVPAMMVYALVFERSSRADQVEAEIYGLIGGPQVISGPLILVPAITDTGKFDKDGVPVTHKSVVAYTPETLNIEASVDTSQRHRAIYAATIYDADIVLSGKFSPLTPPKTSDGKISLQWDQAVIALKLASSSSLKGVRDSLTLTINGQATRTAFEPGIDILRTHQNIDTNNTYLTGGVTAPLPVPNPQSGFSFSLTLPISGGGSLHFSPIGEKTVVNVTSDWPSPSFQGAYLPEKHEISETGFSALWQIPYLARNLPRSFIADSNLTILDLDKNFGVRFISSASPYQSVNRALKYALMFLGIVFLTFFLFETTTGVRAHPAQYILLGATQVVFYLLVLALAEHIGFRAAFMTTAFATVSLSGFYTATVFHSKSRGLIASAAFASAYALIYLLMKSEDYALLIGSVTAFSALALTMFVTRNLDWYGVGSSASEPSPDN